MHPRLVAAQSELARATENLNNQTRSVTGGIEIALRPRDPRKPPSRRRSIVRASNIRRVGRRKKLSELNNLQRVVDTNRQLYELFYNRLSETSATGDLAAAQARIVAPAVVPSTAAKPNKGRIVFHCDAAHGTLRRRRSLPARVSRQHRKKFGGCRRTLRASHARDATAAQGKSARGRRRNR